jgi:hypothetical protein
MGPNGLNSPSAAAELPSCHQILVIINIYIILSTVGSRAVSRPKSCEHRNGHCRGLCPRVPGAGGIVELAVPWFERDARYRRSVAGRGSEPPLTRVEQFLQAGLTGRLRRRAGQLPCLWGFGVSITVISKLTTQEGRDAESCQRKRKRQVSTGNTPRHGSCAC